MAFDAYDDYEQSERVQQWLRENGMSIVVGIVIGLVCIFGVQQWRSHKARNEGEASQLYQQAHIARESGKADQVTRFTDQLMKDHAKSPYAVFAVSERARAQVDAKQLDKALTSLKWAQSHAGDPVLKSLIALRLARVEMAGGNNDGALKTLDTIPSDTYQGLVQELRGDALVKLKRSDDARKAYQTALSSLSKSAPQQGVLQMKLDNLAVAGKQGA